MVKECKKCGYCCTNYPCATEPADIPKIAKFLGMTVKDVLVKYFTVDYYVLDNGGHLYYICPKRKGDVYNQADFDWAFSKIPCIFLDVNNECKIHEIKPKGGRAFSCYEECNEKFSIYESGMLWKRSRLLKFLLES